MNIRKLSMVSLAVLGAALATETRAQTTVAQAAPAADAAPAAAAALAAPADAPPAAWSDTVKLHGSLEIGFTGNPDGPGNGLNYGQLFTDKANELLLNQLLMTAERPLDPKAEGDDYGFKFQAMIGTDARYTHFLGEFDRTVHDRTQFDIVEANFVAHFAALTEGGVDIKLGQYSTPLGAEVIDATANTFYSHSYIFNFGLPLKHTGGYATFHLSDMLDIYAGGDTGVNTSLFHGDNNGVPAFLGGFGLNGLMDGKLTVLALTHIGAENPSNSVGFNADAKKRYLNDVVLTYKYNDDLTFTTELNYVKDDGFHAQAYGAAQYATYALNDTVSLAVRGEVYRDQNGFFVAAFPNPLDFVNLEKGEPAQVLSAGKATYGELTLGLTYKPDVPDAFTGTMLRPELRFDRALSGNNAYSDFTEESQVTMAIDLVVPF